MRESGKRGAARLAWSRGREDGVTARGMRRQRAANAFTLAELMVVIAIIGTLAVLLLPAVQAVRESSRRSACGNTIRQIGFAMQYYHDARGAFPAGVVFSRDLTLQVLADGGMADYRFNYGLSVPAWGAMILPYIEQVDTYNQVPFSTGTWSRYTNSSATLTTTIIISSTSSVTAASLPIYSCASDTLKKSGLGYNMGASNYVGNYGVPVGASSSSWNGSAGARTGQPLPNTSGVLYHGSSIRLKDITDGSSKTFLVGEVSTQQRGYEGDNRSLKNQGAGAWPAVPEQLKCDDMVLRQCDAGHPLNSQFSDAVIYGSIPDGDGFGSRHPQGANFVMCDASVRFVDETIDSATSPIGTYQRLSSRADGLTLPKDF